MAQRWLLVVLAVGTQTSLGPDLLGTGPVANWAKEYSLWLEASGFAKM